MCIHVDLHSANLPGSRNCITAGRPPIHPQAVLEELQSHRYCSVYAGVCVCVCMCVLVAQLCPTLCDPMDYNLRGCSVHGFSRQE